jgi:hypothetical protein
MLKHCFLVYKKHYDFFSFETLGRMHKNIFFLFYKVFFLYFGSFDENRVF